MIEEKIENMVMGGGVNEDIQGRIKKFEKQEEIRERKEKINNTDTEMGSPKKRLIRNSCGGNALERTSCRSENDRSILDKKRNKHGYNKIVR